ncbi:hypothetical protein [Roseovarius sp. 2305UL8-3]|uniref:hypothetical protein n=1 Tax=Roseovarius conchicola TaxID=3121636 RepID=UPI003527D880
MEDALFHALVEEAALAPSAHNTQPARWVVDGEQMHLGCAAEATLPVADPTDHDTLFGCGTALEGMMIALSRHGLRADVHYGDGGVGHGVLATVSVVGGGATPDPLADWVTKRFTCRAGFSPVSTEQMRALKSWARAAQDVRLITERDGLSELSEQNDTLSLRWFRGSAFRQELMAWSRMSPRHPRWDHDGLNARALGLSRIEALAMPLIMKGPVFRGLRAMGLAQGLLSERDKTLQVAGVCFLTVPQDMNPVEAGRLYYRRVLELTAMGFATWPMSVIKDDAVTHADWLARFGLKGQARIVACLRVGVPSGAAPERARRPIDEVIGPPPP